MDKYVLLPGDCLEILKELPDDSVDSLVTDPPAGISFMGKAWDSDKGGPKEWIAWMASVMRECKRVMKPGAHGLVWAIPRTSHWTATACEDAGFEIRDVVTHLFGSGFPKSLDVSKAIAKAAGAERVEISRGKSGTSSRAFQSEDKTTAGAYSITAPSTPEAKKWQGFGTALKPASEHWILIRKPLGESTVAKNVLKHGTGALNIDASRIKTDRAKERQYDKEAASGKTGSNKAMFAMGDSQPRSDAWLNQGRFPANLVFSCDCESSTHAMDCAVGELDRQSGNRPSRGAYKNTDHEDSGDSSMFGFGGLGTEDKNKYAGQQGGASRFFYCAKVSASERNAGLEGMPEKAKPLMGEFKTNSGRETPKSSPTPRANFHPTVKPQKLMRYLCKMITPPGGIVLDPFMGSGSTGLAAITEGFEFIGIEREQEYFEICEKRLQGVTNGKVSNDQDSSGVRGS